LTMAYAYFKANKHHDHAVFDVFFRKNPFRGEYAVFAGLDEVLRFLDAYKFTEERIEQLRHIMGECDEEFFAYLLRLDLSDVKVYAPAEGTVMFPRVPLLRLEGPIGAVQLLETTILNLLNYASLVATNAARHRAAVGDTKQLLEFGLRRAQGPDGGLSAARYSYIGGFDATSNVAAGALFGMPVKGTHAHSFVSSFTSFSEVEGRMLVRKGGDKTDTHELGKLAKAQLVRLQADPELRAIVGGDTNLSELAAFVAYALAFPNGFLALIDTYDVMRSGLPNFMAVALALQELGYVAHGLRLDSGDLAYLSKQCRETMSAAGRRLGGEAGSMFDSCKIVASNDIHEDVLHSLNEQGHCIDAFGVGTHLVTCYKQPALGCVYKLVEMCGEPRIKLSEDVGKITIPGKKKAFRLYGKDGQALLDIIMGENEPAPVAGERVLCRHPFAESKRAYVRPSRVEPLQTCVWDGKPTTPLVKRPDLKGPKARCTESLASMREDHLRAQNPTPYKVSVSDRMYQYIHQLWLEEAPVGELE